MSNTRYLEIDSTYRNREQFPKPSRFEVLISQTGIRDRFNARDPVSNAAPIVVWNPLTFLADGTVKANGANTTNRFLVGFPQSANFEELRALDYFAGLVITVGATNTMIIGSEYESTNAVPEDCYWLTVETAITPVPPAATDVKPVITFDTTNGLFWIPDSVFADNFYGDFTLWNDTLQQGAELVSYEGSTHTAGVDLTANPLTGWSNTHQYSLRLESPRDFGTIPLAQTVANLVEFPIGFTEVDGFYVGSFIRITSGPQSGAVRRIISYSGPAKAASAGFPDATPPIPPTPAIPARLARISEGFSPLLTGGEFFEILQFTRDNNVPFVYTGSLVSQQEMVCYEVELINLVLPNRTLVSGGRSAFYPYVYVELQNISSASAGNTNIIYSNNQNATRRLFRAAIDDIPNPLISPFIKIDGDGMVQTIKFKPNDSFRFGVYLPNGDEFDTVTPERYSPEIPNSLVQISAMFSMKRL